MLTCICLEASSEYRVRGARSMPGSRSTEKEARDSQYPKLKSDNYVDSNGIRGHYFRVASHLQGILFERTITRGEVYRKGHTKLSGKAWNITKKWRLLFLPREGQTRSITSWGFARSFQFTLSKSTTQADHYVRDAPSGLPSLMEREACLSVDRN
jgi:hypothetical protein